MRQRILVFLFGDLGDALLTVPALRALRLKFPGSRIVLLAKPVAASIVTDLNLVDDCILVDKHLFDRPVSLLHPRALLSLSRLASRLKREQFDTVVLFHHLVTIWGTLKFALLALYSGASERVGLDNGRGWFLTLREKDRGFGALHEGEYWLRVAALLDAPGSLQLDIHISDSDRSEASGLLEHVFASGRPIIAVHPGTGAYGPGRRWHAEGFAAAIDEIMKETAITCVIVGTNEEAREAARVETLLSGQATSLVGKTSIGVLAAVLERSTLLLANDGGVAHVAAAVNTPVVAVFGPSNEYAWRPLTARVVASHLPCRPCFYRDLERGLRHGCETRECMALVSYRAVAVAALDIMRERHRAV